MTSSSGRSTGSGLTKSVWRIANTVASAAVESAIVVAAVSAKMGVRRSVRSPQPVAQVLKSLHTLLDVEHLTLNI